MREPVVRLLLFRERRGEIQQHCGKFALAKRFRQIGVVVQHEHGVRHALRNGAFRRAHYTYAVDVEPHEQHIGARGGAVDRIFALTATQIEHNSGIGVAAPFAQGRPTAPLARTIFWVRFDIARACGKTLLERKTLWQTRRGGAHDFLHT